VVQARSKLKVGKQFPRPKSSQVKHSITRDFNARVDVYLADYLIVILRGYR
jgi:hypothetical protein